MLRRRSRLPRLLGRRQASCPKTSTGVRLSPWFCRSVPFREIVCHSGLTCGLLPGLGFTNCTDFSTTTVPYVDSTAPVVGFRYTAPGSAATTFFGDVSLTTNDYSGQWVLVPFGVDGGGVSELQVFVGWDNTANPPGSGCSVTRDSGWIIPSNDTQPVANPGEPVSNGLYLYKVLRPSDLNSSSNCIVTYEVDVVGTDYAGNESSATFTLTYSP